MPGSTTRRSSATSTAPKPTSIAFEQAYKGKLADARGRARMPARGSPRRSKRYEALEDLLGRHRAPIAGPPPRRRHHRSGARQVLRRRAGAASPRPSLASPVLHARAQPDRRRRARSRDGRSGARPLPAVDRGHPQGEALPARGPRRAALPREVGDRPTRAWNRLFDETMAGLRFKVGGEELAIEPTLNLLQDPTARSAARPPPRRSPRPSRRTSGSSRTSPTRSPRTRRSPTAGAASRTSRRPRHLSNRVEPEVVDALVAAVRAAYPRLSHRYYALKAQVVRPRSTCTHWDRNAPLPEGRRRARSRWDEAQATVLDRLWRASRPRWPTIAERFFDERWIDAPVRPGKAPGAFAHPTVPSRAPLRAAQLPGQAARRDDARPRARPRRAPGAGRAARAR